MKHSIAFKRLSRFGFIVDGNKATFWTRNENLKNREVELINQNGSAILFPIIIINPDGSKIVVKRNHTIKAMIAFLKGE